MAEQSEAGPSRPSKPAARNTEERLPKRGKKTGGPGKKGKKFMDDKSSILNLIEGVTSAKEASIRKKLSKFDVANEASRNGTSTTQVDADDMEGQNGAVATGGGKASSEGKGDPIVRKKSRALQHKLDIDRAKAALIEKAKEKKRKKKGPPPTAQQPAPRRKVAFTT